LEKTRNNEPFELLHQEFLKSSFSPSLTLLKKYTGNLSNINFHLTKGVSPKGSPEPFQMNIELTHYKFANDHSLSPKKEHIYFIEFLQKESLEMIKEYCTKTKDLRILFNNDFFVLNLKINIYIESSSKVNPFLRMYNYKKNVWSQTYPVESFF
jgi:hypothetical protein